MTNSAHSVNSVKKSSPAYARKTHDVAPRSFGGYVGASSRVRQNCNRFLSSCNGNSSHIPKILSRFADFTPGLHLSARKMAFQGMAMPRNWTCPDYIDGRSLLLAPDDQGQTSACTAFGMTGVLEALRWWATGVREDLDAAKLYAREKQIDGDNRPGSSLETAIKAAQGFGWFGFKNPEGKTVTLEVFDIQTIDQIKYALHRCPAILFGFNITDAWMKPSSSGAIAPSKKFLGGHCVVGDAFDAVGVDICNSWSTAWGAKGHAKLTWAQVQQQMMCAKGFLISVK